MTRKHGVIKLSALIVLGVGFTSAVASGQDRASASKALIAGQAAVSERQLAQAERHFQRALQHAPRWRPVYAAVGQFYAIEMRDCPTSVPYLDVYIDMKGPPVRTHLEVLESALFCQIQLKRWERSLEVIGELQLYHKGRSDHSSSRALDRKKAQVLLLAGDAARSLAVVERLLFDDYGDVAAHVLRARGFYYLSDYEQALAQYRYVQLTFEPVPFLNLEMGTVLNAAKSHGRALAALRSSIEADGDSPQTQIQLAIAYGGLGKVLSAERSYRSSLKQLSGLQSTLVSTARNNLAWLIITDSRPGDPRLLEALELARQVVSDTGGQNAGYCDTLAEAWLRLGRPDKALEWGRRALMIDPFSDYLSRQNERFESYSEGFSTSGSVVHLEKWRE